MVFGENLKDSWQRFITAYEFYHDASGMGAVAQKRQCAILLHCIGSEAQEIYRTFTFAEDEKDKYVSLKKKFEEYFIPRVNITYERFRFNTCSQKDGQTYDSFITDLRTLARTCDFGTLRDSLIKDRIVVAIRDVKLQEKLLRQDNADLEEVI